MQPTTDYWPDLIRRPALILWASAALFLVLIFVAWQAGADIPRPPVPPGADEDDMASILLAYFKKYAALAMIVLFVIAFVIAAYAGIVALYRILNDRDGWGLLLSVFFAAVLVLAFVGFVLYQGDQALDGIVMTPLAPATWV